MMCHNDGSTYKVYTPGEEAGDGYDRCTWDGAARIGEMKYCSVTENYGNGGNYIPSSNRAKASRYPWHGSSTKAT